MNVELFPTARNSGINVFTDNYKDIDRVIILDGDDSIAFAVYEIDKLCDTLQTAKAELLERATSKENES